MAGSLINIDFGNLPEVAWKLVDKVSDGVGWLLRPWQTRRVASADADALKIKAQAQMEIISEAEQRGLVRFITEQWKIQNNMESITAWALPNLLETATPESIEDDWITNFFDKCRLTSDDEMQSIWSRILAWEANNPWKFSKRTINCIASLDKKDAILFTKLCNFIWRHGSEDIPLIFDTNNEIYKNNSINFQSLKHLDLIWFISFEALSGYVVPNLSQKTLLKNWTRSLVIKFASPQNNELPVGHVMLTQIGQELSSICERQDVPGFEDYLISKLKQNSLSVTWPLFTSEDILSAMNEL